MRKRIGELLVEAGVTSSADVEAALGAQRARAGTKLGQVLVGMNRGVTQQHVARALSQQFELPFIELPQIPASVSSIVPVEFQTEHRIVPFQLEREGKVERVHLAIADPANMELVDELRFQLGKPIRVFVAAQDDIDEVLSALGGEALEELETVDVEMEEEVEPEPAPIAADDWLATAPPPVSAPSSPPPQAAALPPEWDIFDTGPVPASVESSGVEIPVQAERSREAAEPKPQPVPADPSTPAHRAHAEGERQVSNADPVQAERSREAAESKPQPARQVPDDLSIVAAADLDDLLGDVSAVQPPLEGAQPLTRPALPPPPGRVTPSSAPIAQVHKFEPPPRATPVVGTPAAVPSAPAIPSTATPVMGTPLTIPGASTKAPPPSNLLPPPEPPALETRTAIEFSDEDLAILENLERMAQGDEPTLESAKVKPAQMVASLIRLLMKKGVIAETEFLEELGRK